jgi:type I restriction enzyme S subunit
MGSEWQTFPLEECMDAIIDYRGKTPKKTSAGVPLVTAKIVKNGSIQPVQEFIAEDDYVKWMRRGIPQAGDVLLTTEAPLGQVAQLDNCKVALAQRLITLRGKSGFLDNTFLKFLMQSDLIQNQLRARSTGTTVIGIKQKELRKIILLIPPFPEQQVIAHILGSLDDKIELNRKMNKTLEAIARAIFKSWFIDFDPVIDNALQAGNPIPDSMAERAEMRRQILDQNQPSSSSPLSQKAKDRKYRGSFNFSGLVEVSIDEIYGLFPDSFQDSEIGEIPRGWEVKEIGEVVIFNYGKALKASDRKPGNVPVFGSNGQVGLHNEALVKGPGVVIGRKGNPGVVTWSYEDFFPIDTTFYVKKTGVISSLIYLFYALKTQNLPSLSADSAVPGLNRNLAYKSKILVPNEKVLTVFDGQIEPLFQKIHLNEIESKVLTYLHDTLLPKLISGELRIPDAEKFVEEAGV